MDTLSTSVLIWFMLSSKNKIPHKQEWEPFLSLTVIFYIQIKVHGCEIEFKSPSSFYVDIL